MFYIVHANTVDYVLSAEGITGPLKDARLFDARAAETWATMWNDVFPHMPVIIVPATAVNTLQ